MHANLGHVRAEDQAGRVAHVDQLNESTARFPRQRKKKKEKKRKETSSRVMIRQRFALHGHMSLSLIPADYHGG